MTHPRLNSLQGGAPRPPCRPLLLLLLENVSKLTEGAIGFTPAMQPREQVDVTLLGYVHMQTTFVELYEFLMIPDARNRFSPSQS